MCSMCMYVTERGEGREDAFLIDKQAVTRQSESAQQKVEKELEDLRKSLIPLVRQIIDRVSLKL